MTLSQNLDNLKIDRSKKHCLINPNSTMSNVSYSVKHYEPYSEQFEIEDHFSLTITKHKRSTKIIMQVLHQEIDTEHIPSIVEILEEQLPTVLQTTCYNEENLPFAVEVQRTEIGHLFEHILLEYLCQYKMQKGASQAAYNGRTHWNWYKDRIGQFHIRLTCGKADHDIFPNALDKSIALMKYIYEVCDKNVLAEQQTSNHTGVKNGSKQLLKLMQQES